MTLAGNLGFVPIDEILRLLTRSSQQGAVEVTGDGFRGRVFVGDGGVDLATISDDDVLVRHLENSGLTDVDVLRRISFADTTLAAETEGDEAIANLLREMTVESLYQISDRGGDFQVLEGQTTAFGSPKPFDLESLLRDAQDRGKKWAKVGEVVPDLNGPIRLRRDLGEREEVSIRSDDWKVLSEIGDGRSVREIADQLGTTEFWVASVVARLASNDLVRVEPVEVEEEPAGWSEPTTTPLAGVRESFDEPVEQPVYDEPVFEESVSEETSPDETGRDEQSAQDENGLNGTALDETALVETPEQVDGDQVDQTEAESDSEEFEESFDAEDSADEIGPDDSWWQEPVAEEEEAENDDVPQAPEVVGEGLSEIPPVGANADTEDGEDDTEAFLEKVFSELDSDDSETEEGHGLLRRRRMGTLRDFSSDS